MKAGQLKDGGNNMSTRRTMFTRILLLSSALGILPILTLATILTLPLNLTMDQLRLLIGIMVMAMPIATLCLAALIATTIKRPLQNLRKAQRQFYSGDSSVRIPLKGDKDSINLYRGFNIMAELVDGFHRKFVNDEKQKVLSLQACQVAHDMRTPLSVLKCYFETPPDQSDTDFIECKNAARRSVYRLIDMSNDLVDFAKADKIKKSVTDVTNYVLKNTITQAEKNAEKSRVNIINKTKDILSANVDKNRLERVLDNLIQNAIQATEEGGTIVLNAQSGPNNDLVITIEDNGCGMSEETLHSIFERFYTSGKKGGTGLGLTYCKKVIDAHGGKIKVKSKAGSGTVFTIILPDCVIAKKPLLPEKESPRNFLKNIEFCNRRFLIADDDPEVIFLWKKIITKAKGHIEYSSECIESVQKDNNINYKNIDAAIVDFEFKGQEKTGIDLIKSLKDAGIEEVHLCTGYNDDPEVREQALEAGVTSIIPKPS